MPAIVVALLSLAGAAPAEASEQDPSYGGATATPGPSVAAVGCREGCLGERPQRGSLIALRGARLGDVVDVRFLGRRRAGDEAVAHPSRTSRRRVLVVVPATAVRGRLVVRDADGTESGPSPVVRLPKPVTPRQHGGPVATAVTAKRTFYDGVRQPTLTYALTTGRPAATTVQVVREVDGAVVASFDEGVVEPGEQRWVAWDGAAAGGVPQPDGRYAFVVLTRDVGTEATASSAQAPGEPAPASAGGEAQDGAVARSTEAFTLLGHRFPVRGKHRFGDAAAAFGGGRGHEGQDVFAACGTPIVAARGGVVKMGRFQSRAGNYVVIDAAGTDVDMAYMHLRDPALVEQRERVRTGQLIGHVGDTGRASGCHLHFEMWSGPGWYTGGSPFDPLPHLQAWDAVS